jgi:hypothetical protein
MGNCYEKLGNSQARQAYERVLKDYSDQGQEVAEARAGLAALEHGAHGTELVTRRIWAGPGADYEGSPSPDGRYFSCMDWGTHNAAIYDVATGKKQDVTHYDPKSGVEVYSTILSPHGNRIAYFYYKGASPGLGVIRADGSNPRILHSNKNLRWVEFAGWSPDGETILALLRRRGTGRIAQVSVADGSVRVLKTLGGLGFLSDPHLVLSPDGRYIACARPQQKGSARGDIFLLAVDGSREIPLVQNRADNYPLGWALDASHLLFASDRTGSMDARAIRGRTGSPKGLPNWLNRTSAESPPWGLPGMALFNMVSTKAPRMFTSPSSTRQRASYPSNPHHSACGPSSRATCSAPFNPLMKSTRAAF